MKIKEVFIDGFGHFHHYSLRDLSSGLTIIIGSNEAGKSTLLAFIRRMLFGKPPGRSFNPYEPLNGGDHGGRLTVESDTGELYDITRFGPFDGYKISDKNGTSLEKPITSLIGSADQHFYNNVFAFGLEELYAFEMFSDESVQNHVTGAGVGIKTCSIPTLQKNTKDEINFLYYRNARSKPLIMKKFKDISTIEKTLKDLSKTQDEYDRFQQLKRADSEALSSLNVRKRDVSRQLEYWNRILGIWDEWSDYQQSCEELDELPEIDRFPVNGVHSLDRIKEKIQDREENKVQNEKELRELQTNLNDITLNTSVLKRETEIHALERGFGKYHTELSSRQSLSEETEQTKEHYRRSLSAIDPGWNDNTLLSFDRSSTAKSQVVNFRKKFRRCDEEKRDLLKEMQQLDEENTKLIYDLRSIEQNSGETGDVPLEKSVKEVKGAIEELYTEIPALNQKKAELESIQKEEAAEHGRWKEKEAILLGKMPLWPAGLILLAGVISSGFGILNDSFLAGVGLFLVFAVVAAGYFFTAKKHNNQNMASDSDTAAAAEKKVLKWADLRQKKETEILNLESQLTGHAKVCGFEALPGVPALSNRRSEVEEFSAAIQERKSREMQIIKLEGEQSAKNEKAKEKKKRVAQIEHEISDLKSRWAMWLQNASLGETLLPEIVLELFPQIEIQYADYHTLHKKEEDLQHLGASAKEYEKKVDLLLRECELPSCGLTDGDVESLVSALKQNSENLSAIESTERSCKKLETDIQLLSEEIESLKSKQSELFVAGSSADEDEFRENARIWEKRESLNMVLDSDRRMIHRAADRGMEFEAFAQTLGTLDLSEIRETKAGLEGEFVEIEESIAKKNTSIGQISEVLKRHQTEDESALLESQRLALLQDLREDSREWAKRVIALHLLNKAVEKYEKERQPAVIKEATGIFSAISNGRYQRIIKPLESDAVLVEEVTGGRKTIGQLSRGTAEQLYLALRFGYITEFGKHDVGLPVVFDDILVNFDPVRKENSCQAIAQLAGKNQVIYFTCHPDTAEMLKESRPDALVIDLERNVS